jgi:hypothetical protein
MRINDPTFTSCWDAQVECHKYSNRLPLPKMVKLSDPVRNSLCGNPRCDCASSKHSFEGFSTEVTIGTIKEFVTEMMHQPEKYLGGGVGEMPVSVNTFFLRLLTTLENGGCPSQGFRNDEHDHIYKSVVNELSILTPTLNVDWFDDHHTTFCERLKKHDCMGHYVCACKNVFLHVCHMIEKCKNVLPEQAVGCGESLILVNQLCSLLASPRLGITGTYMDCNSWERTYLEVFNFFDERCFLNGGVPFLKREWVHALLVQFPVSRVVASIMLQQSVSRLCLNDAFGETDSIIQAVHLVLLELSLSKMSGVDGSSECTTTALLFAKKRLSEKWHNLYFQQDLRVFYDLQNRGINRKLKVVELNRVPRSFALLKSKVRARTWFKPVSVSRALLHDQVLSSIKNLVMDVDRGFITMSVKWLAEIHKCHLIVMIETLLAMNMTNALLFPSSRTVGDCLKTVRDEKWFFFQYSKFRMENVVWPKRCYYMLLSKCCSYDQEMTDR